jgi:Flp pilus assembly protein TadD
VRIARWTVARAYRSLGRNDDALALQRQLEAEGVAANAPDGYVYEELGELLLANGERAVAQAHFARAFELLDGDATFRANEPERLSRLRQLGGIE